jgi:signal transduction histidine kinase
VVNTQQLADGAERIENVHEEPGMNRWPLRSRAAQGFVASARGLALCGVMIEQVLIAVLLLGMMAFTVLGFGLYLLPGTVLTVRRLAIRSRRLAGSWCDTPIRSLYLPRPPEETRADLWRRRYPWLLGDPATWRDLLWLVVNPLVGWFMTLAPAALIVWGLFGIVMPAVWKPIVDAHGNNWYAFIHVDGAAAAWLCVPLGAVAIALGTRAAPWLLGRYGQFAHSLLAPTRQAELEGRASRLEETRSAAIDARTAELRRIEENLRHGALTRLDAMGMTLRSAEQVLAESPEAAGALLAEARRSSAEALAELRDLVRSIHPPVLADRGLGDAIRALALDSPLQVEVAVDLPGRVDPAVESAAYFAVRELLTRAVRERSVRRASIDVRYAHGTLRIDITDYGAEGAAALRAPVLQDIEHRLAAFEGILAVSGVPSGPVVMSVELPSPLM